MKNTSIIKIKNTVGYNLLKIVFSLYVIIAILITALHMYSEYSNEKYKINQEMKNIENMVKKQLTISLWYINIPLIEEIINGILSSKSIIGVSFESSDKVVSGNFGTVEQSKKNIPYTFSKSKKEVIYLNDLYVHKFELRDKDYQKNISLGSISLYSRDKVIYERIENNFLFIIINSIIKTFALWIIFLFFSNKYLTKPFFEIIHTTNTIDYKNLEKIRFAHNTKDKNEFDILKDTFNRMFRKLNKSNNKYLELNKHLEDKVKQRTKELEKSLNNLKETQEKLVHSEKMASLGFLISGVSNELNTPVTMGLTNISYLQLLTETTKEQLENNKLDSKEVEEYLQKAQEITTSVNSNIDKIAHIIKHFKQVSVDQTSELKRVFNIRRYTNGLLVSLSSVINKKDIDIKINCDENLEVESYPGFYSQILTKLIHNSINHGFKNKGKGNITIDVTSDEKILSIIYKDNGEGIPKENIAHIFDPFFTTNKDAGGIGLGLHIIFNIITSNLNGTIKCESVVGKETIFYIEIPL